MTLNDALMFVWNYRSSPKPHQVPHLLAYTAKERLLQHPACAVGWAGVITGLCDRHPDYHEDWEFGHKAVIDRSRFIHNHRKARLEVGWAEHLANRWIILATDREAWALLYATHYATSENQRLAAQTAVNNICFSIEGKSLHDSKGNLVGTVYFEDLRIQMSRLAKEFSRFTIPERNRAFDFLPFSRETQQIQLAQGWN